jgi:hypothetical protein
MAWTQSDVDALKAAIGKAGNAAQVRFADGRQVQYLTAADAAALLTLMQRDVNAAAQDAGTSTRVRAFRARMGGGY